MRQTISALVAAIAVVTASAVPAMACGGGLFGSYGSPCAQSYVPAYTYSGCGCGGWGYERLPDPVQQYSPYASPVHQYYYADQGPTYGGPGNFAPYPTYRESEGPSVYGYPSYPRYRSYHRYHHSYRYGYAPRYSYHTRYAPEPYRYGHRVLRRYY
jgi:hypothetical protein